MKTQTFRSISAACLLSMAVTIGVSAQHSENTALSLIVPYEIEVTYDKTTHIIFPSGIRYIDLGSDNIVAGKAQDADNVLRVKASVACFEQETNFSVITEDGHFYGFNVHYSEMPQALAHNIEKGGKMKEKNKSGNIRFEELGVTPASVAELLMEALYEKNRRHLRNTASESYGITFALKGLYVHNGKYYFHTQIENDTHVPFIPDFIRFSIMDRKVAKRTVIQELALKPLRSYRPLLPVKGNNVERNIYLLDIFTLTKGQVLEIEMVEKNGGRGQVLKLKAADLQDAQPVEKLRLRF